MNISGFKNWMQSVLPPEQIEQLPVFFDWLYCVRNEPGGETALFSLEKFALEYFPKSNQDENPARWGFRWFMLEALEGCRHARRFHEEGDRNTNTRQSASDYRKDLTELRKHLKGALDILRRHDRQKNPLLAGHVFDLWTLNSPKHDVEFYEEREIIRQGPGVIDENGVFHMAEGSKGRGRSLTPATVTRFFKSFLDTLEKPPRFPSDFGSHRQNFGCLYFPEPRADRHKKKTEASTMLAALLVTLFSHYRRGYPSPLYRLTSVEKGIAEDHKLAASLINVTMPSKDEALDGKQVKDRIGKLLSLNPGVKVKHFLAI